MKTRSYPSPEATPAFLQRAQFERSVNRKLWAGGGLCGAVALGSLALAFLALARPTPVIAFDAKSRPIVFEDTVTPRLKLTHDRVEGFVEVFLSKLSLVDSHDLEEDLKEATDLMSERLRKVFLADSKEIERRGRVEQLNLKARFEQLDIHVADFDPDDLNARLYVAAYGAVVLSPKVHGFVDEAAVEQEDVQYYYAQVVVDRVRLGRMSPSSNPFGLQVDHVKTWWFDSAEDLEVHRLKERK